MSSEPIMIWEVVATFEYKEERRIKRKRYFAKPDGDDIGKFLSNFLSSEPIISVEVHQYQANLTPIETEDSWLTRAIIPNS